jgi:hypothetical protein
VWPDCIALCFKALFELPSKLQTESARVMMSRYVPVIESHFPGLQWPRHLVNDPEKWLERSGRKVPDEPALVLPGDATFLSAVDGLLLAHANAADQLLLTSSCVYAIDQSIHAQMQNVWVADDPEAEAIWRRIALAGPEGDDPGEASREFIGRGPAANAAAVAVREREWFRLVETLTAKGIWDYPEPTETDVESALSRWKEREYSLMTPVA